MQVRILEGSAGAVIPWRGLRSLGFRHAFGPCHLATLSAVIPWRGLRSLGFLLSIYSKGYILKGSNPLAGIEVVGILPVHRRE